MSRPSIGEAIDALAWEIGELTDAEFDEVWPALGLVVRAITRTGRSRFTGVEARAAVHDVVRDQRATPKEQQP